MASTYSTNLKIELQATGENSGTWGTITNTNLGTALEQAIVGYGNPNYASDANLTLTYTDTNAAQAARALVLNVTSGVSLTATRELVVPTIQKQYIVQNNTTGSQSITVKTSAGTGITVPNGRKAHLYVNGTDVIYMDDYVDINGGAIDGTTIGASSASTGAFTTLTTSSTVTLNGGTANGVLYLDGSKVATSGSALTFDGNGAVISVNSSSDALRITQVGAGNALLVEDSANPDASPTAITATGAVGIGTASPSTVLHVKGTAGGTDPAVVTGERVRIQSNDITSRSTYMSLIAGTAANSGVLFGDQDAADVGQIRYLHSNNSMQFYVSSAEVARFDSSGNLGLGVTPSAWESNYRVFDIGTNGTVYNYANGTMAVGNNLYVTSGVFKYKISSYAPTLYAQFTGQHAWYTAASGTAGNTISFTQAMTLDASGRLGIGTTSPASGTRLHMVDSAGCILRLVRTSNRFDLIADTDFLDINARDSGTYLRFLTADTERARITAGGNLLVGGTAARATTDGAAQLVLFNGTAPVGTLTNGVSLYSSSGDLNFMNSAGNGFKVGYRNLPPVGTQTGSYSLGTGDVGKYVQVGSGGSITIPDATFAEGDVVSIFNNTTGNITITCTITTAYIAGTDADKASVTLATRGVATILFISSTVCVISGNVS